MTAPRILIAATAYVYDENGVQLTRLWSRVVDHLNPGIDIVLVEPASPFEPAQFLGWPCVEITDDPIKPGTFAEWKFLAGDKPLKIVCRFPDNVGHLSRGGKDGAGRCYCKAMEIAIAGGYDWVAFMESDILFLRPITPIINRMKNNGAKVAGLPLGQFMFCEFGVSFYNVEWLKTFDLIGRYDWQHSQPWPIPEVRLMNIMEEYLTLLPIYGLRVGQFMINQGGQHVPLNPGNLANAFVYAPIAWITQASDFQMYFRALALNNINLK